MSADHLTYFFSIIKHDSRMTKSHMSLYMALFDLWTANHFENPITFTRKLAMTASKIKSIYTYHRLIKNLNDYGYINYIPSFHPIEGSKAFILNPKSEMDLKT